MHVMTVIDIPPVGSNPHTHNDRWACARSLARHGRHGQDERDSLTDFAKSPLLPYDFIMLNCLDTTREDIVTVEVGPYIHTIHDTFDPTSMTRLTLLPNKGSRVKSEVMFVVAE